jgi:hypothetical protein
MLSRWAPHLARLLRIGFNSLSVAARFPMSDNPRLNELIPFNTVHGVLYSLPGDLISGQFLAYGAHTRNEVAMVLDQIGEGDVCVDIGAHIGSFAIPFAQKARSGGKVLAIEACPWNRDVLDRNVAVNGLAGRIQTVCAVVGDGSQPRLRRIEVEGNTGAGFYTQDPISERGESMRSP